MFRKAHLITLWSAGHCTGSDLSKTLTMIKESEIIKLTYSQEYSGVVATIGESLFLLKDQCSYNLDHACNILKIQAEEQALLNAEAELD